MVNALSRKIGSEPMSLGISFSSSNFLEETTSSWDLHIDMKNIVGYLKSSTSVSLFNLHK